MPTNTISMNMTLPIRIIKSGFLECIENFLDIRTLSSEEKGVENANGLFSDGTRYESINYWYLYRILQQVGLRPTDVVFDLGSGMGRFVCMAARRKIIKAVGVELSPDLCRQARKNAVSLRGRRAPIDIVCEDAALADVTEGTVFYMYNPFGEKTTCAILENIRSSLDRNPRPVTIIYANPVHEALFKSCGFLNRKGDMHTPFNLRVSFWCA